MHVEYFISEIKREVIIILYLILIRCRYSGWGISTLITKIKSIKLILYNCNLLCFTHKHSTCYLLIINHLELQKVTNLSCYFIYEGDSIYNEIALITPPTHGLELYTIYGMKDQGFTFRMVHRTLFYHSYLSSYRL